MNLAKELPALTKAVHVLAGRLSGGHVKSLHVLEVADHLEELAAAWAESSVSTDDEFAKLTASYATMRPNERALAESLWDFAENETAAPAALASLATFLGVDAVPVMAAPKRKEPELVSVELSQSDLLGRAVMFERNHVKLLLMKAPVDLDSIEVKEAAKSVAAIVRAARARNLIMSASAPIAPAQDAALGAWASLAVDAAHRARGWQDDPIRVRAACTAAFEALRAEVGTLTDKEQ